MRTAVVHEWLVTYAGSERALEQILSLYPEADLYSLIDFLPEGGRDFVLNKRAKTSFLQHMPLAKEKYRNYLPLMPLAIERFDMSAFDLVISSSHAVAKGVRTTTGRQTHVCYCYTPIRYAWDLKDQYLRESGLDHGIKGWAAGQVLDYIKSWDYRAAQRVDHFIAISEYIAERIRNCYGRDSAVIYPPVDTASFPLREDKEDFYLAVARMVPYKKMDLIVEAFGRTPGRRLVVVGEGPDMGKVRALAKENVEFMGFQPHESLRNLLQRARAFVFAADEDFGITTVEAQACGTPVIAYGKGGSLETVEGGRTGVFFEHQTVKSLLNAVEEFEGIEGSFDHSAISRHAERFSIQRFRKEFGSLLRQLTGGG